MRKNKRAPKTVTESAVRLFAYIGEHPKNPQVKRVDAILELLAAIRNEKRFYEKAELLDRLRAAFRRYRWIREILFFNDGPHEMVTSARRQTEDDGWEYGAVHLLITIAEYYPERLSSIRRCAVCGRWMLTAKSNHRFCSGKCRQYDYDNDPERQEQHRANMRRLYRLEKEREERAKRAVGFTKGAINRPKKSAR